jgi:hypothetical protein
MATFSNDAKGVSLVNVSNVASLVAKEDGLINHNVIDVYNRGSDARAFRSPRDVINAT